MARRIARRAVVTGVLVARSALHVGAGVGSSGVDMTLAVDGKGRVHVPGTSLAGAFRAWCERAWPSDWQPDLVRRVWGFQDRAQLPERSADYEAPPGMASRIVVEDARVEVGAVEELRDGVGIDRVTGVAASRIKFDRAVLPAGTRVRFELRVELSADSSAGPMVAHLVRALETGAIRLGAATTRGLGRIALVERRVRLERFDSRDGLVATLRDRLAPDSAQSVGLNELAFGTPAPDPQPYDVFEVTICWRPRGPVMVRAAEAGLGVDGLPLTTRGPSGVSPLLPGSELKGILRAQAERIVRTVRGLPVPTARDEQLDVPLVRWLFGAAPIDSAAERGGRSPAAVDGPLPGRGALSVDDCLGAAMEGGTWDAVVAARSLQEAHDALQRAGLTRWEASPHVAIDRWTGGAARGQLFSVLEPREVDWEPMRISVDLARLPGRDAAAARALLGLVLDDLVAGRIPIGFGVNRGFGDIEVGRVEMTGAPTPWEPLAGAFLDWLPRHEELKEAWMSWQRSEL